jgi:uncharacterized membrane protein YGL010W
MTTVADDAPNALVQALAKYARYHRDKRNILTHFFGIPLIVFGVQVLLAHAGFGVGGIFVSALWLLTVLSCAYYFRLELAMGAVMALWLLPMGYFAQLLSATAANAWLIWGVGLFALGWILQFIGHYFEGKKPAFVDDLIGLAIGPLFVAAELLFLCGLRRDLEVKIVAIAGTTRLRVF